MLADLAANFLRHPMMTGMHPAQKVGYVHLAGGAKEAHRFVLSRDAVHTIHGISESSPARFLAALNVCRLPFPTMWVEFAYKDRHDWQEEAAKRNGITIVQHDMASAPSRLGFLLEQEDDKGQVISVTPVWTHHGDEVSIAYKSFRIDARPEFNSAEAGTIRAAMLRQRDNPEKGSEGFVRYLRDPKEFEAVVALESRITQFIPPFMKPLWLAMAERNPNAVKQLDDMARFDLRSEWRFTLALLVTLNSRNVIDYGPVETYAKLNKARAKSGKPSLLSHREIRLSLSNSMRRRTQITTGAGRDTLQEHVVMGHFKVRKSGVFWWSPHYRGTNGKSHDARTYVVTG
jgi:hypothetical protein